MDDGHGFDATDVVADKAQATTKAGTLPNSVDRRIRRLQDLRVDAVQEPDPLRSNLRAATADLLEIGYRLGVGIKAVMGADPASLDRYAGRCRRSAAWRSFTAKPRALFSSIESGPQEKIRADKIIDSPWLVNRFSAQTKSAGPAAGWARTLSKCPGQNRTGCLPRSLVVAWTNRAGGGHAPLRPHGERTAHVAVLFMQPVSHHPPPIRRAVGAQRSSPRANSPKPARRDGDSCPLDNSA